MKDKTEKWLLKYGIPILYVVAYVMSTGLCLLGGFAFIGWFYSG